MLVKYAYTLVIKKEELNLFPFKSDSENNGYVTCDRYRKTFVP